MRHRSNSLSFVESLLLECMPERSTEFVDLFSKYGAQFRTTCDKPGFLLEGGPYGLVLYSIRTMQQVWIMGYAAWSAVDAFGGMLSMLYVAQSSLSSDEILELPGMHGHVARFTYLLDKARDLSSVVSLTNFDWPQSIPHPVNRKPSDDIGAAVFDLTSFGAAYAFLHELKHVIFETEGAPDSRMDEELQCDKFARSILLSRVSDYSKTSGDLNVKVLRKRAIGAAFGAFLVLLATPNAKRVKSDSHPPVADRLEQFGRGCDLPGNDRFGTYVSSVVLAVLVNDELLPSRIYGQSSRDLYFCLVDCLRDVNGR